MYNNITKKRLLLLKMFKRNFVPHGDLFILTRHVQTFHVTLLCLILIHCVGISTAAQVQWTHVKSPCCHMSVQMSPRSSSKNYICNQEISKSDDVGTCWFHCFTYMDKYDYQSNDKASHTTHTYLIYMLFHVDYKAPMRKRR